MARTQTVSGAMRNAVNEMAENVKFLQSSTIEKNPELAVAFLDGLRNSLDTIDTLSLAIRETFRLIDEDEVTEDEVTESE